MSEISPPGPPAPGVTFLLITLGGRARASVDLRLAELGIAYRHLSALGHLYRQPGLSYSELARRARVSTQSMQATMSQLEQDGLVERGGSTTQGRRADLRVTTKGRSALRNAEAAMRAVDEELLADVAPGTRTALEQALSGLFAAQLRR